jgi:hypothetical protein
VALSDALSLEELRTWRDNLIAALKTPETASAYGGMPDTSGAPVIVHRMGGRAQLLAELKEVQALIEKAEVASEEAGPYMLESRGVC